MTHLELVGGPWDGRMVPDTGPQHFIPIPPRRSYTSLTRSEIAEPEHIWRGVYDRRRGAFTGLPYYEFRGIE